jgi:hypothetical protein
MTKRAKIVKIPYFCNAAAFFPVPAKTWRGIYEFAANAHKCSFCAV